MFTGLWIGELLALGWRDVDLEQKVLRVTQTVYDGHFDEPKTQRSKRSVPLSAKSIEILSTRKPAGVDPESLVFATRTGTLFERHNVVNKQACTGPKASLRPLNECNGDISTSGPPN